jgi:glutamine amidotransferase
MIAIIQYNAGNSRSMKNALDRLGCESCIISDIEQIKRAEKVIFPGVGEAGSAMNYLINYDLNECIVHLKQPFLGVCLGMQLMCTHSEERDTDCLGIFNAAVKKYPSGQNIPQMGWNNFEAVKSPLFNGISTENHVYFANSYYAEICAETVAVCHYSVPFSAAMRRDNFYATQFHPEKSGKIGEKILSNFLEL